MHRRFLPPRPLTTFRELRTSGRRRRRKRKKQSKAKHKSSLIALLSLLRWGRLRTKVAARCEHVFHALEPPGRNIVKSALHRKIRPPYIVKSALLTTRQNITKHK